MQRTAHIDVINELEDACMRRAQLAVTLVRALSSIDPDPGRLRRAQLRQIVVVTLGLRHTIRHIFEQFRRLRSAQSNGVTSLIVMRLFTKIPKVLELLLPCLSSASPDPEATCVLPTDAREETSARARMRPVPPSACLTR